MHGVRKVGPSSEEQEEKKRLGKQRKIKIYTAGRDRLFEKQRRGEYDDEVLELSGKLLEKNADIYTFWNMRRMALLALEEAVAAAKTSETRGDESAASARLAEAFAVELELTQRCLTEENPKSYGAWHHRGWCLSRMAGADLTAELALCSRALQADERNFHCWDHRRLVCRLADVAAVDELAFSDAKINANFSNYSAWHYRSSLLPRLFADPAGLLPIAGEKIASELKLATNAFFTDPDDQSTWIYATWLFSRRSADGGVALRRVVVDATQKLAVLTFDRAVTLTDVGGLTLVERSTGAALTGQWRAVDSSTRADRVWLFELDAPPPPAVVRVVGGEAPVDVDMEAAATETPAVAVVAPASHGAVDELIREHLNNCRQLMELEPTNKRCRMAAVECMRLLTDADCSVDAQATVLAELPALDPKRRRFYADRLSQVRVWARVGRESELSLRRLSLSSLHHVELMTHVVQLDLAENALTSLRPLRYLRCLRHLTADENQLEDLRGLEGLPLLSYVSVAANRLSSVDVCLPLAACAKLERLVLCENPVCADADALADLVARFAACTVIPHWL